MTQGERDAFNRGIDAMARLAQCSADVMRGKLKEKPTRYCFAIEALDGLVEAARDLRLPDDPASIQSQSVPRSGPRNGGALCIVEG